MFAWVFRHHAKVFAFWQDNTRSCNEADSLKLLIHNLDLSYRLEWVGERKVLLTRHGQELGTFQLWVGPDAHSDILILVLLKVFKFG